MFRWFDMVIVVQKWIFDVERVNFNHVRSGRVENLHELSEVIGSRTFSRQNQIADFSTKKYFSHPIEGTYKPRTTAWFHASKHRNSAPNVVSYYNIYDTIDIVRSMEYDRGPKATPSYINLTQTHKSIRKSSTMSMLK